MKNKIYNIKSDNIKNINSLDMKISAINSNNISSSSELWLAHDSALHQYPTVTNVFAMISYTDPGTIKLIREKSHTDKNKNVSYALQKPCGGKETPSRRLHIIELTRYVLLFLDYVHETTDNQINKKRLRIRLGLYLCDRNYWHNYHNLIPICTYVSQILVKFNID